MNCKLKLGIVARNQLPKSALIQWQLNFSYGCMMEELFFEDHFHILNEFLGLR
jgi:hypothetical protein